MILLISLRMQKGIQDSTPLQLKQRILSYKRGKIDQQVLHWSQSSIYIGSSRQEDLLLMRKSQDQTLPLPSLNQRVLPLSLSEWKKGLKAKRASDEGTYY